MKISVNHLSNSHNDWLRALDFYKQEIKILRDRLTQIAGKNSEKNVLTKVEQFENQLKVQRDNIDRLSHDIHSNVETISHQLQKSPEAEMDASLFIQHHALSNKFEQEERIVKDLRKEFNDFAAGWI